MNMQVSPAAITGRRQSATRTADLDARLKTVITAHAALVRTTNKAKKEFDALKAEHPQFASPAAEAADYKAAQAYWRERKRLGLTRAEKGYYTANVAEYRSFQKVLLISPATRSGCRLAAKFVLRQLPRQVCGPLSNAAARIAYKKARDTDGTSIRVMNQFATRRSIAYDNLSSFLLRLAE
jgi:hypothetical protein